MRRKKAKRVDPLDEALEAKEKVAADRAAQDHAVWSTWKADPTPENAHQLLRRFAPVIRNAAQMYRAPNVNPSAMQANLKLIAMDAASSYSPDRGAAFRTHLTNYLRKGQRFNAQQQNKAYIPEGKSSLIGDIDRAHQDLREELGRQATSEEVADFINSSTTKKLRRPLNAAKVDQIQASRIRDVSESSFESDPTPKTPDLSRQNLPLLRLALPVDQRELFDHLYGLNGKSQDTSTGSLATKLGKSPSQISRMRTSILNTYKQYNP